jgi:hypothetical protein
MTGTFAGLLTVSFAFFLLAFLPGLITTLLIARNKKTGPTLYDLVAGAVVLSLIIAPLLLIVVSLVSWSKTTIFLLVCGYAVIGLLVAVRKGGSVPNRVCTESLKRECIVIALILLCCFLFVALSMPILFEPNYEGVASLFENASERVHAMPVFHDTSKHVAFTQEILRTAESGGSLAGMRNPFFASAKLRYYWFTQLIAAGVVTLSGLPPGTVISFVNIHAILVLVLSVSYLSYKICPRIATPFVAAFMLLLFRMYDLTFFFQIFQHFYAIAIVVWAAAYILEHRQSGKLLWLFLGICLATSLMYSIWALFWIIPALFFLNFDLGFDDKQLRLLIVGIVVCYLVMPALAMVLLCCVILINRKNYRKLIPDNVFMGVSFVLTFGVFYYLFVFGGGGGGLELHLTRGPVFSGSLRDLVWTKSNSYLAFFVCSFYALFCRDDLLARIAALFNRRRVGLWACSFIAVVLAAVVGYRYRGQVVDLVVAHWGFYNGLYITFFILFFASSLSKHSGKSKGKPLEGVWLMFLMLNGVLFSIVLRHVARDEASADFFSKMEMFQSVMIAVCVSGMFGAFLEDTLNRRRMLGFAALILVLLSVCGLYLKRGLDPVRAFPSSYYGHTQVPVKAEDMEVFKWIRDNTDPNANVLFYAEDKAERRSYRLNMPVLTDRRVIYSWESPARAFGMSLQWHSKLKQDVDGFLLDFDERFVEKYELHYLIMTNDPANKRLADAHNYAVAFENDAYVVLKTLDAASGKRQL